MQRPELSLVMPAYNEAENLREQVRAIAATLAEHAIHYEIVLVDNGSNDETGEIVRELASEFSTLTPITLARNAGYGGGVRAGLAAASGSIVGWADADGQQSPEAIVEIWKAMKAKRAGLAKGVRVIRYESRIRRIQSAFFNALFGILFGRFASDINAKPKLIERTLYEKISLTSTDWFIDAELIIKARRAHATVVEVPIEWRRRARGSSNVRLLTGFEFLWNMLLYRFHMH